MTRITSANIIAQHNHVKSQIFDVETGEVADLSSGGSISATDGTTTVSPTSGLSLTAGSLTDLGGGIAGIATLAPVQDIFWSDAQAVPGDSTFHTIGTPFGVGAGTWLCFFRISVGLQSGPAHFQLQLNSDFPELPAIGLITATSTLLTVGHVADGGLITPQLWADADVNAISYVATLINIATPSV